jgi:molybdopterin/thiamine biosynthesis adenylyltransferase
MNTNNIRYSRQTTLPAIGEAGQTRLRDASVLIIGAGGLGTPTSLYLASSGIGQILINDFDSIDESNLPRQILYRDEDVGASKAQVAAERLRTVNPTIDVVALDERMDRDALTECVSAVDAVIDASDNFATRWLVNEITFKQSTPLISGAAIRWEGQVSVFRHELGTGPCYRCLYAEEDESLNDCAGQGIVAPVAGTIGTLMATETIKVLLGIDSDLQGKLWVYDGLAGNSRTINIPLKADCPVCGS